MEGQTKIPMQTDSQTENMIDKERESNREKDRERKRERQRLISLFTCSMLDNMSPCRSLS
jgi:hypothetical protein